MKTVEVKLYKFEELSEEARARAINDWRKAADYPWDSDNQDVLKEFEKELRYCKFEHRNNYGWRIYGGLDEWEEEFSASRLMRYVYNNFGHLLYQKAYIHGAKRRHAWKVEPVMLTGYYIGQAITDPLREFVAKPHAGTVKGLIMDCLKAYESAVEADYEYYFSEESVAETIEANYPDESFDEDGRIV